MVKIDNLIIGAGPAGLAIAGRMRKQNIPFKIVEKSSNIADSWHNHYDRLHLHTVKQWSHLPHKPFPEGYPTYVSRDQLIEYFENYAKEFEIKPIFHQKVKSVYPGKDGYWIAEMNSGEVYTCQNVVFATGVNRIPHIPQLDQQSVFEGTIVHSRMYKNYKPFSGKKVLVVGMGNTGAELALDLAENKIDTSLSVRGPVNIVPRDLNGQPVQVTSMKLQKLPFGLGTWLGSKIRSVYLGNLTKYGLEMSKIDPLTQLLTTGKTPVIDIGTVKAIKEGKIKVRKGIQELTKTGVIFSDGSKDEFDQIILATGYRPQLEEILWQTSDLLDQNGCPKHFEGKDAYRGLYFVGFDNYKTGGILGIIMEESKEIVDTIVSGDN